MTAVRPWFAVPTPRKTFHARKQGFFSVYKAIGIKAQNVDYFAQKPQDVLLM